MGTSQKVISYAISGLLISISLIYFVSAVQETPSLGDISNEEKETVHYQKTETEKSEYDQFAGDVLSSQVQTIFFSTAGTSNFIVGLWTLKSKNGKMPYLAAMGGSSFLILLYLVSRTVDLPLVGLQGDIGQIDILSKIMQGFVIACCIHLLKIRNRLVVCI